MEAVSLKLQDEKKLNSELMKLISNLTNTKTGSELLIDDSKEEYNTQYYYNWELIIGICIISGILFTNFKGKKV